jgi:predicted transcriptional regulator
VADSITLKMKIKEYGMSVSELSRRSGICRQTLYNRLNGKGEWKASEVIGISKALRLTKTERESIFLS